jgi:hypothetical protein
MRECVKGIKEMKNREKKCTNSGKKGTHDLKKRESPSELKGRARRERGKTFLRGKIGAFYCRIRVHFSR